MVVLAPIPIIGYTMLLTYLARGRAELALLAAVTGVSTVVYLFALAGLLEPAAVAVFWAGVLLCVGMPVVLGRRAPELAVQLLAPGIVLYVLYTVFQWALFHNAGYFLWDEFSHWGLAVKELIVRDRLWTSDGNVTFSHYPPVATAWHYFVTRNTQYSEAAALHAQFLLLLAPTMSLYRHIGWRRAYWLPVVLALQLFLIANLGHGPSSLYMDQIVAVLFGGILVAYLADEMSPRRLLLFVPPLFCLALVKEVGVFLSAAAAVWIAVDRLISSRGPRGRGGRRGLAHAAIVLALVATPLVAYTSWRIYVSQHGLVGDVDVAGAGVGGVLDAVGGGGPAYSETVRERYGQLLLGQQLCRSAFSCTLNEFTYAIRDRFPEGFRLSAAGYLLVSLLLLGARTFFARKDRRTLTWTTGFLVALFVTYSYLVLVFYIAVFPQHKALQVSSYVRYINTIVLPIVMVALACYLPLGSRFGWRRGSRVGPAVAVLCLACLYAVEKPYLVQIARPRPFPPIRERVSRMTDRVAGSVPDGAHLYVMPLVRDNGFFEVLLRYELSPLRASFGTPNSVEEFRGHDFVWVFALDEGAQSRLGRMFTPGYRLFEVKDSDGRIDLIPVM